jgi:hypothetical protein
MNGSSRSREVDPIQTPSVHALISLLFRNLRCTFRIVPRSSFRPIVARSPSLFLLIALVSPFAPDLCVMPMVCPNPFQACHLSLSMPPLRTRSFLPSLAVSPDFLMIRGILIFFCMLCSFSEPFSFFSLFVLGDLSGYRCVFSAL